MIALLLLDCSQNHLLILTGWHQPEPEQRTTTLPMGALRYAKQYLHLHSTSYLPAVSVGPTSSDGETDVLYWSSKIMQLCPILNL